MNVAKALATVVICAIICPCLPVFSQSQIQVGYTLLSADPGSSVPVGTALFTVTNSQGVLVSQAGVAAAEPILSGRLFVDQDGAETAVAFVNPSQQTAALALTLRNSSGTPAAQNSISLDPGKHMARFVSQLFPGLPSGFTGTLTFESSQKLATITLRLTKNAQNEDLYTTLPVIDLSAPASSDPSVFPHIAAGGGYSTQLILMNSSSQTLTGKVSLIGDDGTPLPLELANSESAQYSYSIPPNGAYRAELGRASGVKAGYAVVTPAAGQITPAGSAVFRIKQSGNIVTEAGVGASPATTSARIFVDYAACYTGVAVANPSDQPAVVTFVLLDRFGAILNSTVLPIPARGHIAKLAHELFPELSDKFTGLMEINSTSPVVPITLKLVTNQRSDLILTTLPVADLTHPPTAASMVFPQIAIGGGFSTRLIFISTDKSKNLSGRLAFFNSDSSAMTVPLGGSSASQFNYLIAQGGGRQFLPGNTATIASISLIDASTNLPIKEVVVNQGQSLRPGFVVLDSTGLARDDFDLKYSSLSSEVASIDATGNIQGKKAGFSTLTAASADRIITGTITVVSVSPGVTGFEITGIAQDLARRLYLANSGDHTILRAQDLGQAPEVYAGISKAAGFKNDSRLQSLFSAPAYLAFNQAQGTLFVSDAGNNAIRTVQPGSSGTVSTLAADLNNPRGVALDNRGHLWVADSGSHTIRRISLATGAVETIAGQAGTAGWLDGKGSDARFSSPAGIALETEPLALQLEREAKGLPAPPLSILVADSGNGAIRRVKETGEVETLRGSGSASPSIRSAAAAPAGFRRPAGIAVDPFGNVYVSEPDARRVSILLRTGEVVPAAQGGSFMTPTGMVIGRGGRIVVAESGRPARQISYGEPAITSVTPNRVSSKGGTPVTIKGGNFAPDTLVVIAGVVISAPNVPDTQTITFTSPVLPSGLGILTVQNRAGLAQAQMTVDPVSLSELPRGYITTVAGGTTYAGEGSAATTVALSADGVAVDAPGNIYIADIWNHRVRRIDGKTGTITTVAGNGQGNRSGETGLATALSLNGPTALSFDAAGNLYIADDEEIRKIDAATGIISTVAGGEYGYCGDNGRAVAACFNNPTGVASDSAGNLFIADYFNNRVRKVDAKTGIITTLAGNGQAGLSGDGGPAAQAALNSPVAVAVDETRRILYISDRSNDRVRRVDLTTNVISTVAGGGKPADGLGDNLPASASSIGAPWGVALDSTGNLFIADRGNNRIRKVDIATTTITTVAGNGNWDYTGDGGPASAAALHDVRGIAIDGAGNLLIADSGNNVLRKVDASTGFIITVAGTGQSHALGDGTSATTATLNGPRGVAADAAGNLWITDRGNERVRKVDAATRTITTVIGGGTSYVLTSMPGTEAGLGDPEGAVAFDRDGNVYLADLGHHCVRKLDARTRTLTTVAGTGEAGFSGDGGLATSAKLNYPNQIAIDSTRNILYISDRDNRRVRRITLVDGMISTIAGGGTPGQGIGDGGFARDASLSVFTSVAVDAAGNLFIADLENNRVRKVDISSQIITTVAGGGSLVGENVPATDAGINPMSIAIDAAGNLFILDYPSSIRRVDAVTGKIVAVAGGEKDVISADNGPALQAAFNYPRGIALDSSGNLYIADSDNQRIRAVRGPIP